MKIGIITIWQSNNNYGQILQAFALQEYLRKNGHQPFLIRYDINSRFKKSGLKGCLKFVLGSLKIFKIRLFHHQEYKKKYILPSLNEQRDILRRFDDFRSGNIVCSDVVYENISLLKNRPPIADAYITGSDQVWAFLPNRPENEVFYLNFGDAKTKRLSYAPSFARTVYPSELIEKLSRLLARFDAISVRERSGMDICKQAGRSDAVCVCDPTLLLHADDYPIASVSHDKPFIFIYQLNIHKPEEICWNEMKQFASRHGFDLVATHASGYFQADEILDGGRYEYPSVKEWLGNIRNAEMVLTTSFHGVVFCVLFHKRFIYFPLKGKHSSGNNRVEELLTTLHLRDLIWQDDDTFETKYSIPINWAQADSCLDEYRKSSYLFLSDNLMTQ